MSRPIPDVFLKTLATHSDDRGFFREVIRNNDPFFAAGFGQLSHSLVYPGVIKAWHGHLRQHQWTYVAAGTLRVALCDRRLDSPSYGEIMTFLAGEHQEAMIYHLPPGVVHGYECINGPATVIYVTSGTYEPDEEIRLPHNDPGISFDWLHKPIR